MKTWISRILLFAALAVGYYFLAPMQAPGGKVAYAITSGTSMAPTYHTGDLVLLRANPTYKVGDIAGYHDPDLNNAIVLHRIHSYANGKFTFKGDNKTSADATAVPQSAIVGKAWVHVPHAGFAFKWVATPLHAALIVLVAVLLSFGGAGLGMLRGDEGSGGRRRKRTGLGKPELPTFSGKLPVPSEYALPVLGVLAVVFGLLTLIAFSSTSKRAVSIPDYVTESAAYSYSGTAPKSPVYPTGKIGSGDTVFAKQLDGPLDLGFTYAVLPKDPATPVRPQGTVELLMKIAGDNLWKRETVLVPPQRLDAGKTTLHAQLHLDKLRELLQKVEDETGYPASQPYKVTLTAVIHETGTVGSEHLNGSFSPTLNLEFDKVRLFPDIGTTGDPSSTSFTSTQQDPGTAQRDAVVDVKVAKLSVPTARIVGLAGLLLALAGLAFIWLSGRRRDEADEPTRIAAAYGDWLVPVTHLTDQSGPFADVASFDALVSLATRADRAVMHYASGGTHTYFVKDDDVVYRYTTVERAPAADEPVESAAPDADAPASELVADPEWPAVAEADTILPDLPALPELPASPPAPERTAPPAPPAQASIAVPVAQSASQIAPIVSLDELPSARPVAVPPVVAPAASVPAPAPANGGFVPESPETAYQPMPVATPAPLVVPPQPSAPSAPAAPMSAPATPTPSVVPLAPIAPAATTVPDAGLIRETFLRPRPRSGDANGNGNGNGA